MATLWTQCIDDVIYEVRAAGQTRRLYTDGVFHSQYNPNQSVTGGVWDLLMLPAFFYPPHTIRRVLLLGVGGGAVIRLLRQHVQPEQITGIELNKVHLNIARDYFGATHETVELIHADAIQWLRDYQGEPFDMIIDDLFGEKDGEPERVIALDSRWMQTLIGALHKTGVLVVNTMAAETLKQSAYYSNKAIQRRFQSAFTLTQPDFYNVVGVFLGISANSRDLRAALKLHKELDTARPGNRLNYHIRQIKA